MRNKKITPRFALALALLLLGTAVWSAETTEEKKKRSLKDLFKGSNTSQRSSTVVGVRGLDETGRPADTKARDYDSVNRLEQIRLSDDELKKFISDGQLK